MKHLITNGVGIRDDRHSEDLYTTDPKCVDDLLERENFDRKIWEPACGLGHISDALKNHGFDVMSTDINDWGYAEFDGVIDFLTVDHATTHKDIITNPPYKHNLEFMYRAMEVLAEGRKCAMFLKLTHLEGQKRGEFYKKYPPKNIYIYSSRQTCLKGGDPEEGRNSNAIAYCWVVWEKGYNGATFFSWIT